MLRTDYAFGTWFTWWHPFSMEDGKSNVTAWSTNKLPIDVWALDMNVSLTPTCPTHDVITSPKATASP